MSYLRALITLSAKNYCHIKVQLMNHTYSWSYDANDKLKQQRSCEEIVKTLVQVKRLLAHRIKNYCDLSLVHGLYGYTNAIITENELKTKKLVTKYNFVM